MVKARHLGEVPFEYNKEYGKELTKNLSNQGGFL